MYALSVIMDAVNSKLSYKLSFSSDLRYVSLELVTYLTSVTSTISVDFDEMLDDFLFHYLLGWCDIMASMAKSNLVLPYLEAIHKWAVCKQDDLIVCKLKFCLIGFHQSAETSPSSTRRCSMVHTRTL